MTGATGVLVLTEDIGVDGVVGRQVVVGPGRRESPPKVEADVPVSRRVVDVAPVQVVGVVLEDKVE